MNLQEKFNQACKKVDEILAQREQLVSALAEAQKNLDENNHQLRKATRERDETSAMLSVVPSTPRKDPNETAMQEKQAVFAALRQMPNTWIMPQGLAVLAGVEDATVAAILRRAAGLAGIPVEHNGKRGRASMYRWGSSTLSV